MRAADIDRIAEMIKHRLGTIEINANEAFIESKGRKTARMDYLRGLRDGTIDFAYLCAKNFAKQDHYFRSKFFLKSCGLPISDEIAQLIDRGQEVVGRGF